ncbi:MULTISPECIES: MFS transporter [unclassified Arcicella]|uniref:MFS transporter n=1 Tax=unclassified Arcicella TaxID=2644986 RepID=UPI002855481B|nr:MULTISPECIES: MFS transporter [unclassified Arcicella]MDR6563827.1 MFS family permease [Arcicella sp. BE51]MDR6813489.1 MFS family permease [Arcicella sp. BE140]MDR6824802.1 MFS family permease [Arcicella sp. BE139]
METKLGLKENWQQFTLLVIVNAFVGGMVGLERSIIPQLAETEFGLSSKSAILSFIVAFGITKAMANYFTGRLANKIGRRKLLIIGWVLALPISIILIYANSWSWVIGANILLGLSQGLTWSSTVVMKMDLVGEKQRGLAMGINEFAGYLAVGVVAFLTGYIAENYGVRPYPFYIGIFMSVLGLLLTIIWVKDTKVFVSQEAKFSIITHTENVFLNTTFKNKTLSSVTQAGLVNNLNDGMIWGLLPILLLQLKLNNQHIGIISAIYPTVWGIGQLFTGKISDLYSKKKMFLGNVLARNSDSTIDFYKRLLLARSHICIVRVWNSISLSYILLTIAQATNPNQRAESIGTFRLWRDLGYAFLAIISGIIADIFGIHYAVVLIGLITIISSIIIQIRMPMDKHN